jgi:3,4-dihydroxy 2-butanone 4-phosphate synthase / GTP cyclohydrolase II
MNQFNTILEALEDIKAGKMVVVLDDEDRENEGDFVMAAEKITPDAVNFMATVGRGLICTPITKERAVELDLELMVRKNDSLHETAFTVSIDHISTGTGISTADRSQTIESLVDPNCKGKDLLRPGHIFPLIAKDGGVLRRAGHTEAAVDLSRLAGFQPAGVICEIMAEDGTMERTEGIFKLAKKHDLKVITIKDLIEYRKANEIQVTETAVIDFPNDFGSFKLHMFQSTVHDSEHHIALVKGDINASEPTLVRVHSECFTGDIFGSKRCDCGDQLKTAMALIEKEGSGVVLYMRQEGRGIGLPAKIQAYILQDQGHDTVTANQKLGFKDDLREYGVGAQILKEIGVGKMRLLTNNPKKIIGLDGFGLEIVERVPLEIEPNEINKAYFQTKKDKMGHIFHMLQ